MSADVTIQAVTLITNKIKSLFQALTMYLDFALNFYISHKKEFDFDVL